MWLDKLYIVNAGTCMHIIYNQRYGMLHKHNLHECILLLGITPISVRMNIVLYTYPCIKYIIMLLRLHQYVHVLVCMLC
jgi:hypothetical protein